MTPLGQGKQHGVPSASPGEPSSQSLLVPKEHLRDTAGLSLYVLRILLHGRLPKVLETSRQAPFLERFQDASSPTSWPALPSGL